MFFVDSVENKCKECCDQVARLCIIRYDDKLRLKCPCSMCLVKMVCKKLCQPRNRLYSSLSAFEKDKIFAAKKNEVESRFLEGTHNEK